MKKFWLNALFLPLLAADPGPLVKTKIGEGITVMLPSELKPMLPEDVAQRYPSVRAPLGAYTNEDRDVDFSVNISATQWPDKDIDIAKEFFKASIYNLYDKIDLIGEGIYEVHKRKFIFFEFVSKMNGSKMIDGAQPPMFRYTFIQYRVESGRAIVFSFSCPRDVKDYWQKQAHEVMKSVTMR